jgi:predicted rRNA methylase YqxC with S4 and FtsJ domains
MKSQRWKRKIYKKAAENIENQKAMRSHRWGRKKKAIINQKAKIEIEKEKKKITPQGPIDSST